MLLDRFVDSSLAYQGAGRALGVEQVAAVNASPGRAAGGPARCCCATSPPSSAAGASDALGAAPDRLELEDEAFFARIAEAYSQLARDEPQRIHTIDASAGPDERRSRRPSQRCSPVLSAAPGED